MNADMIAYHLMTKPTQWHVRQAKTQISLGFRPVWTESSLCTKWVAKGPVLLQADSEDSDQTGWMPRLIWVFAGRTCHFVGFVMRWLILISWGTCAQEDRKMKTLKLAIILSLLACVEMWPRGAPNTTCVSMMPGHGKSQQSGQSPYTLTLSKKTYKPNERIQCTYIYRLQTKIEYFVYVDFPFFVFFTGSLRARCPSIFSSIAIELTWCYKAVSVLFDICAPGTRTF